MPPAPNAFHDALILTGPTGSGKSAWALEVADALNAEIVCADSMTVYRGLDIGTAKPTAAEQARVPHHLLNELDPWESASVAWWLDRAAAVCESIRSRGKIPLFVGGTPFYLKALLYGLFEAPAANAELRELLEDEAKTAGPTALHARLTTIDPTTAARLHPNDVRRVVRALEVFAATGQPISALQQTWKQPPRAIPLVVLDWPRARLHDRLNQRVDAMLEACWLAEADRLWTATPPPGREAAAATGYAELAAVARGEQTLPEARLKIQARTRQLAKRQLTFLRGLPTARWVPAAPLTPTALLQALSDSG